MYTTHLVGYRFEVAREVREGLGVSVRWGLELAMIVKTVRGDWD